jgi:small subunit ribosomal protein S8
MTDPIADMLTRIRNALAVRKAEVVLPFSKMKFEIGKILEDSGLIEKTEKIAAIPNQKENKFEQLKINLKYLKEKEPAIRSLKKISKPGQRVYATKDQLPKVLGGLGMSIISTSQGLMTDKEARKRKLGGEVICEIW